MGADVRQIMSVALPMCDRLPKIASIFEAMPKETYARMLAYFTEQKNNGNLSPKFDCVAAISLFQDLGTAMIMQGRTGAPLQMLQAKAVRNTKLILIEGRSE